MAASAIVLAFSWREKLAAMSWLEMVLWVGLASLTIALLILMGTRWGQVRPVSKCAVLSVFAHLLFLCYAYSTRLNLDGGNLGGSATVRVAYLDPNETGDADFPPGGAEFQEAPPSLETAVPPPSDIQLDTITPPPDLSLPPDPIEQQPPSETSPPPPAAKPTPHADPLDTAPALLPDPAAAAEPTNVAPPPAALQEEELSNAIPPNEPLIEADPPPEDTQPDSPPPAEPPSTAAEMDPAADPSAEPPPSETPLATSADIEIDAPSVPESVVSRKPEGSANSDTSDGVADGGSLPPAVLSPPMTNLQPIPTDSESSVSAPPPTDPVGNSGVPNGVPGAAQQLPMNAATREVPEAYRLRMAPGRMQFATGVGATDESEGAVSAALSWLAAQQQADGRWDASEFGAGRETRTLGQDRRGAGADADSGISGLALLAFLGAGHSHVVGPYRETVQHGLEFLLRNQQTDGSLAGYAKQFERMYCHGIACLALGEAFAMTGDVRLQPGLRRAVQYTLSAQDKVSGGWRYQPGDRGDMSQFGWQVMALRSAEAGGILIPPAHRGLMIKFLESATSGQHRGLGSYRPGERPSRTMTAEAMVCRLFLSLPVSDAAWTEATDFVMQELPGDHEPNLYYWYYATLALFQRQGEDWNRWNSHLQRHLLARQHREGPLAGSWDTRDVWGGYGGRIYTTAMATLCLEVYYRYLPLYDPTRAQRHAAGGIDGMRR